MGPGTDWQEVHDSDEDEDSCKDEESDEDELRDELNEPMDIDDGPIQVHKLSLASFRSRLINHFDILWRRNQILWPTRTDTEPPGRINEPDGRMIESMSQMATWCHKK